MNKLPVLICLIFLYCSIAMAQESYLSVSVGTGKIQSKLLYNQSNSSWTPEYGIGCFYEYIPKKALISLSTGIEYLMNGQYLCVPLNIRFLGGRKLIFSVHGGPMPFMSFNTSVPLKRIWIGANFGAGFDYKINRGTIILIGTDFYSIRYIDEPPSHFGAKEKEIETSGGFLVNIGLRFLIPLKAKSVTTPTG